MNGKIKGFHRWMAMFLCVLMCVSLLPVGAASADDGVVLGLELDDDFLEEDSSSVEFGLDLVEESTVAGDVAVPEETGDIDAVLEDESYIEPAEDDIWADLEMEEADVEEASAEETLAGPDSEWEFPAGDYDFTVSKDSNALKLVWEPIPDVPRYQIYRVQRDPAYAIETRWELYPLVAVARNEGASELSYRDTSVKNGYEYIYVLRCLDANGKPITKGRYVDADGTVTDISENVTIAATVEGFVFHTYNKPVMNTPVSVADGLKLSWSNVGIGGGATYEVLRWDNDAAVWTVLGNTTATSFVDKTVLTGEGTVGTDDHYAYAVRVLSADHLYYMTDEICDDGSDPDKVAEDPSAVMASFYGKTAVKSLQNRFDSGTGKNYIRIRFDEIFHCATGGTTPDDECGYKIERRENSGQWKSLDNGNGFLVADLTQEAGTTYFYDDYAVTSGVTYTYRIRAMVSTETAGVLDTIVGTSDENGKSIAFYDTPILLQQDVEVTASSGVTIWWQAVKGVGVYNILRRVADAANPEADETSWKVVATVSNSAQSGKISFTDESAAAGIDNVTPGKVYWYSVVCRNGSNSVDISPYDPIGVAVNYTRMPILVGTAVTADGINVICRLVDNVNRYRVFRRVAGTTKWFIVDTFSASYAVDPLVPDPSVDAQNPTNVDQGVNFIDTYPASHPGIIYEYTVRCMDDTDTEYISAYDKNGVSGTYYPMPQNLQAKCVSGGIQLTWDTDEFAPYYRIYRRISGADPWSAVADVDYTANGLYVDNSEKLSAGAEYEYAVCVLDVDKKVSSVRAVSVPIPYYPMPELISLNNDVDALVLTFGKIANCEEYVIYRKTVNSDWTVVYESTYVGAYGDTTEDFRYANGGNTKILYEDHDVISGTQYWYTVACGSDADPLSGYDPVGLSKSFYGNLNLGDLKVARVSNGAKLTWNTVDKVAGYRVYRREMNSDWKVIANVGTGADKYGMVTYTDTSARNIGSYWYKIVCLASGGEEIGYMESNAIIFYDAPVLKDIRMTERVAGGTLGSIRLFFTDIDGADSYNIYRKKGNATKWSDPVPAAIGGNLQYVNGLLLYVDDGSDFGEDLVSNTKYTYTVAVADGGTGEDISDKNSTGLNITFYQAPQLLKAVPRENGTTVQWRAVKGAGGYKIYRRIVEGANTSNWTEIGSVSGYARQTYLDKTLLSGGSYEYTVRAYRGNVLGGYYFETGDVLAASYLAVPVIEKIVNTSSTEQTISWKAVSGADSYEIYQRNDTLKEEFPTAPTATVAASGNEYEEYVATTAYSADKPYKYSYQIVAVSGTTKSNASTVKSMTAFPPINVLSAQQLNNTGIQVIWTKVKGISAYRIYRQLNNDGVWTIVANSVGGYKYTDRSSGGKVASYKVVGLVSGQEVTSLTECVETAPCIFMAQPTLKKLAIAEHDVSNPSEAVSAFNELISFTFTGVNGATHYSIGQKAGAGAITWTTVAKSALIDVNGDGTLYTYETNPGTTAKTAYTFYVKAVCSSPASESSYNTSGLKITHYPAPTLTAVTADTDKSGNPTATLSWTAVSGASRYAIYVQDTYVGDADLGDGWILLGYASKTTYTNTQSSINHVLNSKDGNGVSLATAEKLNYRVAVVSGSSRLSPFSNSMKAS